MASKKNIYIFSSVWRVKKINYTFICVASIRGSWKKCWNAITWCCRARTRCALAPRIAKELCSSAILYQGLQRWRLKNGIFSCMASIRGAWKKCRNAITWRCRARTRCALAPRIFLELCCDYSALLLYIQGLQRWRLGDDIVSCMASIRGAWKKCRNANMGSRRARAGCALAHYVRPIYTPTPTWYGVASIDRLLTIIGLFCKRAL